MVTMSSRIRTVKVGHYDIQKTIGRGNFAEVKLAKHRITKTEVAIKIIDKTSLDQGNLKKIYREIQILKLLNHQHIIKLYQVMQTKTTIYLVCEYARNGELFDYITQKGKLPEERAQKMFWQVLCAVEYCHKNNVVHRDLKAENMLLDGNNNIKLADFGFGNFFQSGQNLSTWCGSPPYAAPEVFEGKVYEGPQLDVWSLGVVLYVLVCGTFPFDGSNLSTLKERVLGGLFRIPYWMSQDCENLLRRMLVLNPKKRLTISQIKKHKWLDVVRPRVSAYSNLKDSVRRGKPSEYNEHVFKIMQNLGLDISKTKESLSLSAYDHFYAIYHLLADRLKLHRTSYPLEPQVSQRRRPSNIADQVLLSVPKGCLSSNSNQRSSNPLIVGFHKTELNENKPNNMEIDDIFFEDVIAGLPVVNRTLVDSPPLPLIKTTLCPDDEPPETHSQHHTNFNLLHIPSSNAVPVVQQKIATPFGYNQLSNVTGQLPVDNEIDLTGCNLQQRRHTLMTPDASQVAQFQLSLLSAQNASSSSTSRELLNQQAGNGTHPQYHNMNQLLSNDYTNAVYNSELNHNENTNIHDVTEPTELLHLRQRQRTTLNSSPIGFREGRRASDGLLLLGDSLLKEHLQKLARVKGVPELTKDIETTQPSASSNQPPVNSLQNNECLQPVPSNTLYGSNGESLNFQPYSNMQSLSRRRSLQVQHMQMRRSSVTAVPMPTFLNVDNNNHNNFNCQENFSGSHPHVSESMPLTEAEHLRHWSSWKQVQANESQQESPLGSNDNSMFSSIAMSIASDDSVPSKAAVAAQLQRDALQKPVRQQSLPISSSGKGNYPFSSAFSTHPQSLAQQLQQRRFERRIKVASHQNAMTYQSPLPELEHLRIGGEDQLSHNPISTIVCNGVMLNASKGQDNDQFSQEHSVHGIRCFGNEDINFGALGENLPASELVQENTLPINDPNMVENIPFLNFGSNENPVLSWVHNSSNKHDSMEYAMY